MRFLKRKPAETVTPLEISVKQIYLDHNATTPVDPSVVEAMMPFLQTHYGNPSSSHSLGRAAKEAIEDARAKVANLIGCISQEIVFTGGGTEASNMAIKGVMLAGGSIGGHMITTAIEHPATLQPARFVEKLGCELTVVNCDDRGIVSPAAIAVLLHTDASQSIGKIPALVDQLDVDLMTIAGHKFYAPKGIGVLFVREGLDIEPLLHGAGHESGMRAGTENTPYIVGLGQAAYLAGAHLDEAAGISSALRDRFWRTVLSHIPRAVLHGFDVDRLPNTASIAFPGVSGAEMLARVPEVCASLGAACHSTGEHQSGTLSSMGVSQELMKGTIRFSFGRASTIDDTDRAAMLMVGAWEALVA